MVLEPCDSCGRHVATNETLCPFCGAACSAREPRTLRAGRFARAALFAGAALAGCDQGKGHDKTVVDESVAVPRVHGRITDAEGAPLVGAHVQLFPIDIPADDAGTAPYTTITDHRGRYAFDEIRSGRYRLSAAYSGVPEAHLSGSSDAEVFVAARGDERVDLKIPLQYQTPAKPYGAPPARRRVV